MPKSVNKLTRCNLNMIRQSRNYTQKDVGNFLNVSFQQIQKYEKCINELSVVQLLKLCEFFDVNSYDIYPELKNLKKL